MYFNLLAIKTIIIIIIIIIISHWGLRYYHFHDTMGYLNNSTIS